MHDWLGNKDGKQMSSLDDKKREDAKNARCAGLIEGYARQTIGNKLVFADNVEKEHGPFYCPECLSEVIIRKCFEKVDHFAHRASQTPVIRKKDSDLHSKCEQVFIEYFQRTYPNGKWETERPIKADVKKGLSEVIPDLSGRIIVGEKAFPVAIEIQKTPYTVNRILKKTTEYYKRGVYVLWIVPLRKKMEEKPIRPRLFEKFLHGLYFGKIYYWYEELGHQVIPVHFSPTSRWIEPSSWYDRSYGEERSGGGFHYYYRTIKAPKIQSPISIDDSFMFECRDWYWNKRYKKEIPAAYILSHTKSNWWPVNESLELQNQQQIAIDDDAEIGYIYEDEFDYWK